MGFWMVYTPTLCPIACAKFHQNDIYNPWGQFANTYKMKLCNLSAALESWTMGGDHWPGTCREALKKEIYKRELFVNWAPPALFF